MRDMLAEEAEKVGLYDGKNWLDKLHQLLNMSHIKQGTAAVVIAAAIGNKADKSRRF